MFSLEHKQNEIDFESFYSTRTCQICQMIMHITLCAIRLMF